MMSILIFAVFIIKKFSNIKNLTGVACPRRISISGLIHVGIARLFENMICFIINEIFE
jgi:hypothetical protein